MSSTAEREKNFNQKIKGYYNYDNKMVGNFVQKHNKSLISYAWCGFCKKPASIAVWIHFTEGVVFK